MGADRRQDRVDLLKVMTYLAIKLLSIREASIMPSGEKSLTFNHGEVLSAHQAILHRDESKRRTDRSYLIHAHSILGYSPLTLLWTIKNPTRFSDGVLVHNSSPPWLYGIGFFNYLLVLMLLSRFPIEVYNIQGG